MLEQACMKGQMSTCLTSHSVLSSMVRTCYLLSSSHLLLPGATAGTGLHEGADGDWGHRAAGDGVALLRHSDLHRHALRYVSDPGGVVPLHRSRATC